MRDEASCCLDRSTRSRPKVIIITMGDWPSLSILSYFLLVSAVILSLGQAAPEVFTNSFFVRLNGDHGHDVANNIAKRNGFENLGPVKYSLTIYIYCTFFHSEIEFSLQLQKLKFLSKSCSAKPWVMHISFLYLNLKHIIFLVWKFLCFL